MQIFVKTLKGTNFEIEVKPEDTIADVKNSIEISQGKTVYPADQQMLIHQGKVLKDETTLAENNVAEKSFIVVMLRKAKGSSSGASTTTSIPASQPPTANTAPANPSIPIPTPAPAAPAPTLAPAPATTVVPTPATLHATSPTSTDAPAPAVISS